jgi:acetylornithine/N-succinyldiaminopimelate aminotransferase
MGVHDVTSAILPTYARYHLAFESGEGVWLTSTTGEQYLDFGAGIAVNSLGYNHPHLVQALKQQADKLWLTSNLFEIPQAETFAHRLADATFADLVFFCNSGAEAVELTIKMARKWNTVNGTPERYRMVTFEGAFHGRTLATIAAGGNPKYLDGFGPPVDGFDQVPFGDLEAVKAAIGPNTGAILIEPIQGEGGIRVGGRDFIRGLRQLCDERGLLLCFDEVQCGMGRSGKLYAYEHYGIAPDILASAKGIGGGFPLGAVLATAEAAKGMGVGSHGTTYGGNPLAMACGNAVFDVIQAPGFLDEVARKGLSLRQSLASLAASQPQVVAEIRGEGLIQGIKLKVPNAEFAAAAREEKIIVIPAADNVVRLVPPLVISEEELKEGVRRLEAACHHFKTASEPIRTQDVKA